MAAIKKIISDFFRTHCKRQLYFNICRDALPENVVKAIQRNLDDNKIVQKLLESGKEWEERKFGELASCFNENVMGRSAVVDDRRRGENGRDTFEKLDTYLKDRFPRHQSGTFIFEPEFSLPDNFIDRMGLRDHPDFVAGYVCRPDILELLPDRLPDSHERKFRRYLTPEGRVLPMHEDDDRQRLRVIDIKLLSQTSPSYFAEVTLYSMILACWLREHGLDSEYAVVPNAAIWPGSYNESELRRIYSERKDGTDPHTLWLAMQDDLEEAPIEAFVGSIRQFFKEIVPEVLAMTPEQCDAEACVTHRCRGCVFLEGLPQVASDPERPFLGCKDLAERSGHLSLIPLMSEGTIAIFRDEFDIGRTEHLGGLPVERILQSDCKYLKSGGRVAIERAKAIELARTLPAPPPARLLEDTGTSCEMPKSPDVHVYLNTSYDFVHLMTLCFGMRVVDASGRSMDSIRTIEKNDIELEADAFVRFCGDVVSVLEENARSSIQFYFWDEKQFEHFQRLVERHGRRFGADPKLSRMVFLAPPEKVLPNPAMETWQSPRTLVSEVLNPRLVAPIPYHYSLLDTARCYHDDSKNAGDFVMPELTDEIFGGSLPFEESLNSQIPSDRIYDFWNLSDKKDDASVRRGSELHHAIDKAVAIQLDALETIVKRLELDMGPTLFSMPPQARTIAAPQPAPIAGDSEIHLRFSQLDANTQEREIRVIQSLSPLEKESQCESAKIVGILAGEERREALGFLELPYDPSSNMPLVCRLSEDSREAKFKEDDFTCSLAPLNDPLFLSSHVQKYVKGPLPTWITTMADLTAVDILAMDRDRRLIVLLPKRFNPQYPDAINALRDLMLRRVIDPKAFLVEKIAVEFFMDKFRRVVTALGNPPEAVEHSISKKLGYSDPSATTERPLSPSTPAAEMIWNARRMSETMTDRNLVSVFQFLDGNKISLNSSQRHAVQQALSKRLSLLWGPPGTGKSKTLCAIALGAIHEALQNGRPLRLLVTGPTNTAIDNVLHELYRQVERLFAGQRGAIRFLRFEGSPKQNTEIPECKADKLAPVHAERIWKRKGITIVGSTPQQVYKLPNAQGGRNDPFRCGELFDLVLLDEASQFEVPQAFLVFSTLAKDASVVIAGDPLQMPPIRQAGIPKGLEPMLGSVYEYYAHEKTWALRPCELLVNYRSNATIVNLAREANYPPALESAHPDLAIRLQEQSKNATDSWLARLVDPSIPVSAFVHKDGKSNQSNPFEAFCVEKIVRHLRENLLRTLDGEGRALSDEQHTNETFWTRGIGIVTPHRAQQALIVRRLQAEFCMNKGPETAKLKTLIRNAVDTVERFQGQQRDVILISFGMGDRDAIRKEEEFLLNLNRFNVMTSRARAKLILFLSEELVHYVPEDAEVQKQSRFLKAFTDVFCNHSEAIVVEDESGRVDGTLIFYEDPDAAKTIVAKSGLPRSGTLRFERDDVTDFGSILDAAFFDAREYRITDKFLHNRRHFFSLMEFIKTVYRYKRTERIKVSISTTRCNPSDFASGSYDPIKRQEEFKSKAERAAKSVGIDLSIHFKSKEEAFDDHAREIKTDHGWTVLLDRGFDMFVFPPDGHDVGDKVLFDMEEETKMLKTHKSYVVVEAPA